MANPSRSLVHLLGGKLNVGEDPRQGKGPRVWKVALISDSVSFGGSDSYVMGLLAV